MHPFHLAYPTRDLEATRQFYGEVLGCSVGRESQTWIDFDFFGHQITFHAIPKTDLHAGTNDVDGEQVHLPHFGVVLDMATWRGLARRLEEAGTKFVIAPTERFSGEVGEQATLFLRDPSGHALE